MATKSSALSRFAAKRISHAGLAALAFAGALAVMPAAADAAAAHGKYTTIDVPGATATNAISVNDFGVVVGSYTDTPGVSHGFIDRHGVFTTVNDPHAGTAAGQGTTVIAINEVGVLGGVYIDANGTQHGFIDRHGAFTTLNDPLAGTAPGQGTVAFALNNRGIIVGIYTDSHGTTHGFELNNTP